MFDSSFSSIVLKSGGTEVCHVSALFSYFECDSNRLGNIKLDEVGPEIKYAAYQSCIPCFSHLGAAEAS